MSDDPFGFSPAERNRKHLTTKIAATGGALVVLCLVMLIAVYALNAGSLWSSQTRKPFVIHNVSPSTLSIIVREPGGLTRRLTKLAPGGVEAVPVEECLRGSLHALNGRGVEVEMRDKGCPGDDWSIIAG